MKKNNLPVSLECLRSLCYEGLERKVKQSETKKYLEVLEEELFIIETNKFEDYFLIWKDMIRFCESESILFTDGRGSLGNSLVCYILGITSINPLQYSLESGRFFKSNSEIPKICIDIEWGKKEEVYNYLKNKYGDGKVAKVIRYVYYTAQSFIREYGTQYDISPDNIDYVVSLVPVGFEISTERAFEIVPELQKMKLCNSELSNLIEKSKTIEGCVSHSAVHASAIVIAGENINKICPVKKNENSDSIIQIEKKNLELLGLVDFYIVECKSLHVMSEVEKEIRHKDSTFALRNIEINDQKIFESIGEGELHERHYMESSEMAILCKRVNPKNIMDLAIILAIFRPGPISAGILEEYIEKKNKDKLSFIHEDLNLILKETYGLIIFQEQVMAILKKIGHFSNGECNTFRKVCFGEEVWLDGAWTKSVDVLYELKSQFLSRGVLLGYKASQLENIWENLIKYSKYTFLKSHAVGYALTIYKFAFLRVYYNNIFKGVINRLGKNLK